MRYGLVRASTSDTTRLVIIDQDAKSAGSEGTGAIAFALQDTGVKVIGITVVSGDGWEKEEELHTVRLLELIGRTDVPVVGGAVWPLVNNLALTRKWESLYGKLGYAGAMTQAWPSEGGQKREPFHMPEIVPQIREGMPTTGAIHETAAAFMVRMVHQNPGRVSIISLGPATNIAIACALDPHFASSARELILLGSSGSESKQDGDPFSEQSRYAPRIGFNIRWDPEAASIALHAGWKRIVMMTGPASSEVRLTQDILDTIGRSESRAGRYMKNWNTKPGIPLWDPAVVAVFLDNTLVKRHESVAVDIDLDRGANYGAMLTWPEARRPNVGEPIVDLIEAIDNERFRNMFINYMSNSSGNP
ncbi:hypothetical protein AD944_02005 [Acetobacter tropicalis]|nr:hypothetical protein AD944_02005 [Acetobacter tropicalis]